MSVRKVPYFHYPTPFTSDGAEYIRIFKEVGERGAFILQKDLLDFERNLAAFVECKHALGVANGTDAISIALRAAGIGSGDEVIFCSHTFVATASAIQMIGAIPIPVECREDHLIDPNSVRASITSRTRAIVPTQLNGRTCDMLELGNIAEKHGLIIVEDAAQALGSRFKERFAGTFGVAGTISFYPAKALGCFGDGGAILTNDDSLFEKIWALRDHGRDRNGTVVTWGWNSRLDNLHAAILDHKLLKFNAVISRRRELASLYDQNLRQVAELRLPPAPTEEGDHFDTYQNYEIEAERRDELKTHLNERGVGTLIQWGGKAVHQFQGLGFTQVLPYTERMFERCLMLPMNMSLSNDDVLYVARCIQSFYGYE